MTTLVNCTPHDLNFVLADGTVWTLPASGQVARCTTHREQIAQVTVVDGPQLPLSRTQFGALSGLPDPEPGVLYVVSALAAQAAASLGRTDVVVVDDAVRDADGRIVGAKGLGRV